MLERHEAMEMLVHRLSAAPDSSGPPLLFLGRHCARAAGVPDVDEIVQQMVDSLRGAAQLPKMKLLAEHLAEPDHPHAAQNPVKLDVAALNRKNARA